MVVLAWPKAAVLVTAIGLLPVLCAATSPVVVHRGLADAQATVGRFFNYTIPDGAFMGDIDRFEVSEAGGAALPQWLVWNAQTRSLLGIPPANDLERYFIAVTAIGVPLNRTHSSYAKDVFSINVDDHPTLCDDTCEPSEKKLVLVLQLVILTSYGGSTALTTRQKLNVLKRLSVEQLSGRPVDALQFVDTGHYRIRPDDILLSGSAGNLSEKELALDHAASPIVFCCIGCGHSANEPLSSVAERLQRSSADETRSDRDDFDVANWYVISTNRLFSRKKRDSYRPVYSRNMYGVTAETVESRFTPSTTTTTRFTPPTRAWQRLRPSARIHKGTVTAIISQSTRAPTSTAVQTPKLITTRRMETSAATFAVLTTHRDRPTTTQVPATLPIDTPPRVQRMLGTLICSKGILCRIAVPADLFFDEEDGSTEHLKLSMKPVDDAGGWLNFREAERVFIGVALEAGAWKYTLSATDSNKAVASQMFFVQVAPSSVDEQRLVTHRISATYSGDFEKFRKNPEHLVVFLNRISRMFGDADSHFITILNVSTGSVVVTWSNNSLWTQPDCPRAAIDTMYKRFFTSNGKIVRPFARILSPHFNVTGLSLSLTGSCNVTSTTTSVGLLPSVGSEASQTPEVSTTHTIAKPGLLMTTVLPAVIIIVLLFVASVVACLLFRRTRRRKDTYDDAKSKFLSKGTPVIFPDEVDLDKESHATTPMLLREEKPPLEIAEFPSSGGQSSLATKSCSMPVSSFTTGVSHPYPRSDAPNGDSPRRGFTSDHQAEQPLYRPPPPFSSSLGTESSPKPKHVTSQARDSPPFVPP